MPRFNKTGPEGKGPKTGRGLGKCGTSDSAIGEEHRIFFVEEDYLDIVEEEGSAFGKDQTKTSPALQV